MDLNIKPLSLQPRTLPVDQPSLKSAHLLGIYDWVLSDYFSRWSIDVITVVVTVLKWGMRRRGDRENWV